MSSKNTVTSGIVGDEMFGSKARNCMSLKKVTAMIGCYVVATFWPLT